jgi:BirA family biotin operon repressor/biotin-[acetyl-CoA-carboxylase] ligase
MPDWKPRNTERACALRREATPAERALWQFLARSQQGAKFSRQMPVGPWFADFLCRELGLVVELDGFSHDIAPERDARRDAWMAAHGFTVLRFTNADVHGNIEGVVTAIGQEVERLRGLKGSPTPNPSRRREGD